MDPIAHETVRVAPQQVEFTMPSVARRVLWAEHLPRAWRTGKTSHMSATPSRKFVIQGVTRDGKPFRPSDWAERLAGAMASFRPEGVSGGRQLGYSPLCEPRVVNGVSSVIVDESLRGVELLAWDFVMNFARDNNLVVIAPEGNPPASPSS